MEVGWVWGCFVGFCCLLFIICGLLVDLCGGVRRKDV